MNVTKKSLLISLAALAVISLGALTVGLSNSQAASNSMSVTTADLSRAGFTQVKAAVPTATGHFQGPNLYFTVSDKVAATSSEAPNLVMVSNLALPYAPASTALFKYGQDSHDFSISGGLGQEATLADGRVAINFIKGSNYVVIIGPNQAKIEALTTIVAGKIQ
jgi:hypothetical protein